MKPLENIFSNSKTKTDLIKCPNSKIPIVIDTREKQSLIATNLISKKANVNFEKLEVGDYLIGDVLIERKTFADFVSSMIDRRLQEQLINLKKSERCFLLIEGFYYDYEKFNVHENAIRGMLLSIATDFQIPLIFTKNEEDTSNFLILTAKKFEKQKSENSLRQSKNIKTIGEQKQFILEGFPWIGPIAAKKLIEEFGSIKNIINAPEQELRQILGKKYESFKIFLEK
jgi:ERCC4-type nuclease